MLFQHLGGIGVGQLGQGGCRCLAHSDIEGGGLAAVFHCDLLCAGLGEFGGGAGEAAGDCLGGLVGVGDGELQAFGVELFACLVFELGGLGFDLDGFDNLADGDVEGGLFALVFDGDLLGAGFAELGGCTGEAARYCCFAAAFVLDRELQALGGELVADLVFEFGRLGLDRDRGDGLACRKCIPSCQEAFRSEHAEHCRNYDKGDKLLCGWAEFLHNCFSFLF